MSHSKSYSQSRRLIVGMEPESPSPSFLGPESKSGVLNFLTPESECHKNVDSASVHWTALALTQNSQQPRDNTNSN